MSVLPGTNNPLRASLLSWSDSSSSSSFIYKMGIEISFTIEARQRVWSRKFEALIFTVALEAMWPPAKDLHLVPLKKEFG